MSETEACGLNAWASTGNALRDGNTIAGGVLGEAPHSSMLHFYSINSFPWCSSPHTLFLVDILHPLPASPQGAVLELRWLPHPSCSPNSLSSDGALLSWGPWQDPNALIPVKGSKPEARSQAAPPDKQPLPARQQQ